MSAPIDCDLVDTTRPNLFTAGPRPVPVHLYRPVRAVGPARVVLVSHGAGGAAVDLTWLSSALCAHGFLVAALDHHGGTHAESAIALDGIYQGWERALDMRLVLDHLARTETVASAAVAGFSLGGYAAATVLGARLDPGRFRALIEGSLTVPAPEIPDVPDLFAEVRHTHSRQELDAIIEAGARDYRDPRIMAGFIMAPVLGPVLDHASLTAITRPAAIYWGDQDQMAPAEDNAHVYLRHIPDADGGSVGPAEHQWFTDHPDGASTRTHLAQQAVAFFSKYTQV